MNRQFGGLQLQAKLACATRDYLGPRQRDLVACRPRGRRHNWIQVGTQLEAAGHVPNDAVPVEYSLNLEIKTHIYHTVQTFDASRLCILLYCM